MIIKAVIKNTLLVLSSLVFIMLLLELAIPWYYGFNLKETGHTAVRMERVSEHPDIKFELTPNVSGEIKNIPMTINAGGYRGYEGVPGRFPGYRVIALGDSVTFGFDLEEEETFPAQLHQLLNRGEGSYEVLNFGVKGYDTLQEVALLEQKGLQYSPDLVVVGFCLNDLETSGREIFGESVRPWLDHIALQSQLVWMALGQYQRSVQVSRYQQANSPEMFLQQHKDQIDVVAEDEAPLKEIFSQLSSDYPSSLYADSNRVGRLRYAFRKLGDLSSQSGFKVVVAVIPYLTDAQPYPHQAAHDLVIHEAKQAGFIALDLLQDFQKQGIETLKLKENDLLHPNGGGNRVIAEALQKIVLNAR